MGIGELSDGDSNSISLGFSIFILSFQEYLHCAGFGLFSHFLHSLLQAFITEFLFYGGGQRFCFFFFFFGCSIQTTHSARGSRCIHIGSGRQPRYLTFILQNSQSFGKGKGNMGIHLVHKKDRMGCERPGNCTDRRGNLEDWTWEVNNGCCNEQ